MPAEKYRKTIRKIRREIRKENKEHEEKKDSLEMRLTKEKRKLRRYK